MTQCHGLTTNVFYEGSHSRCDAIGAIGRWNTHEKQHEKKKTKESHPLKKMVFCEEKISQTGRAGLPDFTKPYFFLQQMEEMKENGPTRKDFTKPILGSIL